MNKTQNIMGKAKAIFAIIIMITIIAISGCDQQNNIGSDELKTFGSEAELKSFLKSKSSNYYRYGGMYKSGMMETTMADSVASSAPQAAGASDYSTTNIQVQGVDEADIIKNDGKYIYTLSGNKIVIVDAYPADSAEIVSEIDLTNQGRPNQLFVNDDMLIVMGQGSMNHILEKQIRSISPRRPSSATYIKVYDIKDRSNPELVNDVNVEGNYKNSRMIGKYVYAVIGQYIYNYDDIVLPRLYQDGDVKTIPAQEISYFDMPDTSYTYTHIVALNTQDSKEEIVDKVYLLGRTQNMYVSQENMYITYTDWRRHYITTDQIIEEVVKPILPNSFFNDIGQDASIEEIMNKVSDYVNDFDEKEKQEISEEMEKRMTKLQQDMEKQREKTVIHKISLDEKEIEYKVSGTAPGTVLNQFSMDEYQGNFRIATTTGQVSRSGGYSVNNVYVLDEELDIIGSVEDLAPGEKIYSARFMGEKAYIVTFKKVDPLFVIDLSIPTNPRVLGKLKIPGYSDYLHPYDENHVIGIGKETVEAEQGDFAWYQGVKIALFDVSDVSRPKEIAKYEIGDRGTDSYALRDHKAFLFSKERNLLVLSIKLAEIDEDRYVEVKANQHGEVVWQGAYVFDISSDDGISLRGRVSHADDESILKSGYYYNSPTAVQRSLYMDDVLYTISSAKIKMNDLEDLSEINEVELPYKDERRYGVYEEFVV